MQELQYSGNKLVRKLFRKTQKIGGEVIIEESLQECGGGKTTKKYLSILRLR